MQQLSCVAVVILSALVLPFQAAASAEFMPCDTNFFQISICQGQSVFIAGETYDAQNPSGISILPEASWDGTDSVLIINLTVLPPAVHLINASYCNNEALFVNGHIYDASNPSGTEFLPGAAYMGCDSIININLNFLPEANYHLQQTICAGDTLWVNNQAYDQFYYLGMEVMAGGAINGCDSTILVDLRVLPTPKDTIHQSLCPYETLWINGTSYGFDRPSGLEIYPNAAINGCDSLVYIQLEFSSPPSKLDFLGPDQSIFLGDSVCFAILSDFIPESIHWQPAFPCTNTDCTGICLQALQNQTISASIIDSNQCMFSDTASIRVSKERPIYIPNVFAPNAETPNNHFGVYSSVPIQNINWLVVHDRWGSLIYEAQNLAPDSAEKAWNGTINGKIAPSGVYAYAFEFLFPDGTTEVKSGMVTLVR